MTKKKQKTIESTNAPVTSEVAIAEVPVATGAEATPARKPKVKKKSKATTHEPVTSNDVAVVETPVTPKSKGKKKAKPAAGDITLAELSDRYIRALEDAGKSQGTAFSYRLELALAQKELGADTLLRDLTPERVQEFFECARVTKTRGGVLKARVSVEKTKRVLRQALVWSAIAGLVETAPVPVQTPAT